MPMCRYMLVLSCALSCAGQSLVMPVRQPDLADGLAIVTSRTGGVQLSTAGTAARSAGLHAIETLSQLELTSGSGDSIFFALSNGMGLGAAENSYLRFKHYRQQPFPAGKESRDYEPTRSSLEVQLLQGSLVFSAPHLSPLSEIVVQLPQGELRIQRASGQVHYDSETGASISIASGIVTYYYPDSQVEEVFIHAPNRVRISDQDALAGRIGAADTLADDPTSQATRRLVEAARHASSRVFFRVTDQQAAIPQPLLVTKHEDLQQPSPRPYRYLD